MFYKLCARKIKFEFLFLARFFFIEMWVKCYTNLKKNAFDSSKVRPFNPDSLDFFFGAVFLRKDNMNYSVLSENKSLSL